MSIVRLNRVTCLPGREAELERRLKQVCEDTRADPDCDDYRWFRSNEGGDHTTYVNLSRWRSWQGWERHLASEAFSTFMTAERVEACLAGPPDHHSLTEIGADA